MKRATPAVLAAGLATLAACSQGPGTGAPGTGVQQQARPAQTEAPIAQPKPEPASQANVAGTVATGPLPTVLVHKSPTCGCCSKWVEHMRTAGFEVKVNDTDDLEPIKKRLGVPLGKGSCHTAEIGRLVVEGHVPAADIKRLLAANDGARGLVLPGMPAGSPGMELPDGRVQRYTVEKVNADGSTSPFASHGE